MNESEVRSAWISGRADARAAAEASKQSQIAIAALFTRYQRLIPDDRPVIDQLLADDLSSDDESLRFMALAVIREFGIVSSLDSPRALAARLETADGPGAPYEWAKVNRIIAQLSAQ